MVLTAVEQHIITAEELYSLLTSNQDVLLLDVRQPLDLLAYPEIIPGAHWIQPKEVLEKPSLIPREKEGIVLLHLCWRENQPVRTRVP